MFSSPGLRFKLARSLINTNALGPEIRLRKLDLLHQLLVRLGRVAEGEHAPAEAEEDPSAEGDEGPEGELIVVCLLVTQVSHRGGGERRGGEGGLGGKEEEEERKKTYNRHNSRLNKSRERNQFEVEGEVELFGWKVMVSGLIQFSLVN